MSSTNDERYGLIDEIFTLLSLQNHLVGQLSSTSDYSAITRSMIDLQNQIEDIIQLLNWLKPDGKLNFKIH